MKTSLAIATAFSLSAESCSAPDVSSHRQPSSVTLKHRIDRRHYQAALRRLLPLTLKAELSLEERARRIEILNLVAR